MLTTKVLSETSEASLIVENLTCVREHAEILRNISFTLTKGSIMVVQGKNGSGKTTLLRCIAGIHKPYQGKILVDYSQICYLGHAKALKMELTTQENLDFWKNLYSIDPYFDLLESFELSQLMDIPAINLSEGQKKKLSICCSLYENKSIWLADEPFNALDKQSKSSLSDRIEQHRDNGGIIIITTHSQETNQLGTTLSLDEYTTSRFVDLS